MEMKVSVFWTVYVSYKMALSHLRTAYYKGQGQESEWTKGALLSLGVRSVSGVHASLNSVDFAGRYCNMEVSQPKNQTISSAQ